MSHDREGIGADRTTAAFEHPRTNSGQDSAEERALELLVQASRTDPTLRAAVAEVEKWVRRLQEDRSSAWQSYAEADTEAQWQMGAKLEAQQALWLIVKALDLNPAELPAGWAASTKPILARIEAIVDEADRLARERDQAVAALERIEDATHAARHDAKRSGGF